MKQKHLLIGIAASAGLFISHAALAVNAVADIHGTVTGSSVVGRTVMQELNGGVQFSISIYNVTPGMHGIHIHEFGSCNNTGLAAGKHFNPAGAQHGFLPAQGFNAAHVGDLGNINVQTNGIGFLELFVPGLKIAEGPAALAGRAIILHDKADDFTQPLGNAGDRIGCGMIGIIK